MKFKFKLRSDMPPGFKENKQYPELPGIVSYLTSYDGKGFASPEEVQQILDGAIHYLEEKNIPHGMDPELRQGLEMVELSETSKTTAGDVFDYYILTPADNMSGECVFGGLEKIH